MLPGVNMNERQELEKKYKKLSSGLRFVAVWVFGIAIAIPFMPGWLVQLLGKKSYKDHSNTPSLYQQDGIQSLLYCLAGAAVIFLIIVLISGWFGMRRKLRATS